MYEMTKNRSTPHLVLHKGSQGQVVKQVCEELPYICIAVFPQALIIEAISAMAQHSRHSHTAKSVALREVVLKTYTCVICLLS